MTGWAYVKIKGSLVADPITRERARELYDEAAANPAAELAGDAVSGFGYWETDEGLKLVRVRVEPVPAEIPATP